MMITHRCRCAPVLNLTLAAILVVSALGSGEAAAQYTITEIIDSTGDGAGTGLNGSTLIAVDPAGNVYVAGGTSDNAFKITPGGLITEIIDCTGDGTGDCFGAGNRLDASEGIAVDAAGNAYVTGRFSDNAFKITLAGVITEIIDCTGDGTGDCFGAGNGLDLPEGVAVDSVGNVYVTGIISDNAFMITPGGLITAIIDATGDGAGNVLDGPIGIAVDTTGNIYVAGFGSDNAFKITPGGLITEIIDATGDGTGNGLNGPERIAVDGAGNAYVAGIHSDNAFRITPGGVISEIIDATGDGAGNGLDSPLGIAVDDAGNAYVTGLFSCNAFKITPDGLITVIIDATGDGAGNALIHPLGIVVGGAGDVYVAGFSSDNAFKITLDEDGDGVPNEIDVCPNTPAGLSVACDGRPLRDCNVDCLVDGGDIQCIVDEMLNQ